MTLADGTEPLIRLEHVFKKYDKAAILEDFSLTVRKGENVLFVGRSGAGKSTILRIILLLERIEQGTIFYLGHDVTKSRGAWAAKRSVKIRLSYVSQNIDLWPNLKISENLMLVLEHQDEFKKQRDARHRMINLLKEFSILDRADAFPHQLSAGERQRVALARAMASNPDALLLDEVTSNLDAVGTKAVFECLFDLSRRGVTLLSASHEATIPSGLFPNTITYGKSPGWGRAVHSVGG